MKKVAVVGAGFAGLAVAAHLLRRTSYEVVLIDPEGIRGGASRVCAGLLHPYPGNLSVRAKYADVSLESAKILLQLASTQIGMSCYAPMIYKSFGDQQHVARMREHIRTYGSLLQLDLLQCLCMVAEKGYCYAPLPCWTIKPRIC